MAKNVLTQEETGLLSQGIDIYITVTVKKKEDVSEAQQAQAEAQPEQPQSAPVQTGDSPCGVFLFRGIFVFYGSFCSR